MDYHFVWKEKHRFQDMPSTSGSAVFQTAINLTVCSKQTRTALTCQEDESNIIRSINFFNGNNMDVALSKLQSRASSVVDFINK